MKLFTLNPLPMQVQNLIKNDTLLVFILLAYFVIMHCCDRKSRENVQKTLFKGSSYEV